MPKMNLKMKDKEEAPKENDFLMSDEELDEELGTKEAGDEGDKDSAAGEALSSFSDEDLMKEAEKRGYEMTATEGSEADDEDEADEDEDEDEGMAELEDNESLDLS